LLSSRDVFTSGTPVKRNEVGFDPLVSNLTTGVIGAPLGRVHHTGEVLDGNPACCARSPAQRPVSELGTRCESAVETGD
jgi:hypothetical protein